MLTTVEPIVLDNVSIMMRRRGYTIVPLEEQPMTNPEIRFFRRAVNPLSTTLTLVWFPPISKINIDALKQFIHWLEYVKSKHGILIYEQSMTSSTQKILDNLFHFKIELFLIQEFRYCLTDHQLYCPHRVVSGDEKAEILRLYGTRLPLLLHTDPVVRYFDFQKNDIIEITRLNKSIAYRIVK